MGNYGQAYYANYGGASSQQFQNQHQRQQQYGGAANYGHGQYNGAQY